MDCSSSSLGHVTTKINSETYLKRCSIEALSHARENYSKHTPPTRESGNNDDSALFQTKPMLALFFLRQAFSSSVDYLNDRTFANSVESRKKSEVWVVCFTSRDAAASPVLDLFNNASRIAAGMVKFAVVDSTRYPTILSRHEVKNTPEIHIYHPEGEAIFRGKSPKELVNGAINLLPDFTQQIELSWQKDMVANPSAMFFVDSATVPRVWRAIAAHYHGKSLRIGITNNTDLLFPFGVQKTPAILMSNGTVTKSYRGKLNFEKLVAAMDTFFARKLVAQPDVVAGTVDVKQFKQLCIGAKAHCVVVKAPKVTPEIEAVRKAYSRLKMNWLVGEEGLPYDFMKTRTGAWVYNPRRDGFVHADNLEDLKGLLETIENGAAKWQPRSQVIEL